MIVLFAGFIDDTDISDDLLRSIFEFNAGSEHLLLIGDKRKRRILAVFDDTFKPKSAMDVVRVRSCGEVLIVMIVYERVSLILNIGATCSCPLILYTY